MSMKRSFIILFALLLQFCSIDRSSLRIGQVRCNGFEDPSGTGNIPVFSWTALSEVRGVGQSAWQIMLDTELSALEKEDGCLWNSGKTKSVSSYGIPYAGEALQPATQYYWKIRIWDNDDIPSQWSKPSKFVTGLFERKDWSGAVWIGYEEIPDSMLLFPGIHGNGNGLGEVVKKRMVVPCFRKEFITEKKIKQAFVFISGLGHYELYVNGEKTGDRFLAPGWTEYDKTCYYNTYDVTEALRKGANAIGVIAGNGFYNINRERYRKLVIAYGAPKMILKLRIEYKDGSEETIVSNDSWTTSPSPVTYASIYGGEDYDARLEQDGWNEPGFGGNWKKVIPVSPPNGSLKPEPDHAVKVMQKFDPSGIIAINDTLHVYDFGQNCSGIISLKIRGSEGKEVRLIPAELLGADSLVNQRASGSPYYFSYTTKGTETEEWQPRFTYYGFRYVQVQGAVTEGSPNPSGLPVITGLKLLHTRNSSAVAGTFKCSSEHFNAVYDLIDWAIKSNLASVATDCPHREKLGWLEQTHLMGNSIKYVYDIQKLYNRIVDDMIEAQLENGLVPDIAPEYVEFQGGFRDSPEWGSACIIVPWDLYEWYGDIEAVRRAYPMMVRYLSYLTLLAPEDILIHGLGDWYDLGPKFPGVAQLTPRSLTATSIYYYDAKLLAKMATLLGKENDAKFFRDLAEQVRKSFNKEFLDTATAIYSTGSQTAFAMPLFFGMVDDSIKKDVVNKLMLSIKNSNNALTAGDVGYRYLLRVLEQEGASQLIFDMNSRTDVPGYGYQLSKGATALTESWAGLTEVSNNHMMLGHLMEWFFSGIGGVRQDESSKAYENIIIAPETAGDLTWAEISFNTVNGLIESSWRIEDDELTMKVTIPVNCKATVVIPGSDPEQITEGEKPLDGLKGISGIRISGNKTFVDIVSGGYVFRAKI